MVSELDKTSMEVALRAVNTNSEAPPLIGGINYGEQPVGWEKPVAVPTFTSFHLINVIYLNHLF